jgi:hypothetical protein
MPSEMQRSSASLFVRPSSLASSWTRTFFGTGRGQPFCRLGRIRRRVVARAPGADPVDDSSMFWLGPTNEALSVVRADGARSVRSARRSASRCTARSRQSRDPAQSQAPRPGAVRLTRMPPSPLLANRTSSLCGARRRHPTQVRTGPS